MATSVAAPTGVATGRETSKYTGVVALGLVLMGAAVVVIVAAGLMAGQSMGEEAATFTIAIVAAAVGAIAVWRFGTVGKIVGLLATLAVISQVFWLVFAMFQPTSFADFSGGVMFLIGVVYSLGWGIAGIVRRNRIETEPTRGETRMVRGALAVVVLAMILSGVLQITSQTSVDASAAAGATPVSQTNLDFSPAAYEVAAGEPSSFLVHNSDAFTHNFVIEELDINELLSPGSERLIEVTAPAGEYKILCTLHPDMEATLTAK